MESPGGKLEGRVAIVTGAASGIGRATASALARAGAAVLIADLQGESAEAAAQEIQAEGGVARSQQTDVGEEASVIEMVEVACSHFGRLDILHNNAADSDPSLMARDLEIIDMDTEVWDRAQRVNLRGPMLGCKHAIPRMLEQGGGVIVNTSSAAALVGDVARPAYGASKAGLDALTRYVATLYGKRGIRCNSIAPGVIATPALAANVPPEQLAVYERNHLSPRLGSPADIARVVVFLASEDAAFITGQTLCVDGGLLVHHPTYAEFSNPTDSR